MLQDSLPGFEVDPLRLSPKRLLCLEGRNSSPPSNRRAAGAIGPRSPMASSATNFCPSFINNEDATLSNGRKGAELFRYLCTLTSSLAGFCHPSVSGTPPLGRGASVRTAGLGGFMPRPGAHPGTSTSSSHSCSLSLRLGSSLNPDASAPLGFPAPWPASLDTPASCPREISVAQADRQGSAPA